MIQKILFAVLLIQSFFAAAQQNSTNGWYLTTKDTLRILVVFVEVDYDTDSKLEDLPEGTEKWPDGGLPAYADSIFDTDWQEKPVGIMTRYYNESSLGNLIVLGDYLPKLYRVKMSEMGKANNYTLVKELAKIIAADTNLRSNSGLDLKQFDLWKDSSKLGSVKEKSGEAFEGLDHVMIFTRNFHKIPKDNGMASGSSMGFINGKRTDTYSIFAGGHGFPFGILRHELNHLLIGGNNFHAGGGNSAGFKSYFTFLQGGWSMMGASHSSLLTCSGWDRYWLGWQKPGNDFLISARDENNLEVNGDIGRETGGGIFLLRDFETDGDVLRIKLPFIPDSEFQQWLWIENHKTIGLNGSDFDVFQYQDHECITPARPGLYMHVQADANTREGKNIYRNVNADYLRSVIADGNYDFKWEADPLLLEPCINHVAYIPYYYDPDFENPFTGNHAQEFPQYYTNADTILNSETMRIAAHRRMGDVYERISMNGNPRHGFRESGNKRLGVGTNPSSANMLTLVNTRRPAKEDEQNNRKIYINGLSVEILQTLPDASLIVEVRFDDNIVDQNRRWCAPEIVLNNHIVEGPDLIVKEHLTFDIGETMTRFDNPDTVNGKTYFTDPTTMIVKSGAELVVEGRITLKANSKLIIESGGTLTINKKARIYVENGSELILKNGAIKRGKGKVKTDRTGVVRIG
ncbi:hypothetical protein G3O08_01110 [Cryomorpha ignava]|uniref:M6 family metalloprotease domain-containing protein n=1 Tax=Cryomorpha ignava TaxID=101383 RepID=A0A7K3WMI9_9FLAO|nr:hypothetical protein [Cryomorpha ignava]NEN22102.1 hypothetical protein [Cryomorpha ignava]